MGHDAHLIPILHVLQLNEVIPARKKKTNKMSQAHIHQVKQMYTTAVLA